MKESVKPPLEYPKGFLLQFKNCRILRDHRLQREDLWVRDGRIVNPEKVFFDERISADLQIDCGGCIVAPGYIDVQLNGGFGVDFSDLSCNIQAGVETVSKILLEQGVTSFCPTIITSAPNVYHKLLSLIRKTPGSKNGAGVLGVHLEGPFISKEKKGAHPEKHICDLNGFKDLLDVYGCLDNVCLITLAPEYPGAKDAIQECVKRGIRVSLGHSMANLEKGEEAVNQGASFVTHLFNAMLPFHHRDPHLVGLLASEKLPKDRTIFYGLIADGIHTHPAAMRIAQRVHPSGVVLVTDAMKAMGLPEGRYTFGEQSIDIIGHRSLLAGTDTLAGSIAKMDFCVKNFVKYTDCGVVLALEAASLHPAQMLGISDQKGTLDFGSDADFILLDDDLTVTATYIAGVQVWSLADAARNESFDNDKLA